MIVVRLSNGDEAEAETPGDAVFAAQTMIREAATTYYARATASFYVGGKLVRHEVRYADLFGMAKAAAS